MFSKKDMKQILHEGGKYNILLLFASHPAALEAAGEFRKTMYGSIGDTGDKTTLKTAEGHYIFFRSIQTVGRTVDGMKARVIICMPMLEYISGHFAEVCTIKQFKEQEERKWQRDSASWTH